MKNQTDQNELRRQRLHEELCELLGSKNVYFNPPSKMIYPCIRYEITAIDTIHADNIIYKHKTRYKLTLIEYDPTSSLYLKIMEHFMYCTLDISPYNSDGLRHTVLTLYY